MFEGLPVSWLTAIGDVTASRIAELQRSEYAKSVASKSESAISSGPDGVTALNEIRAAYSSNDLVLVLGAGISAPYGLPDWRTLLQKLQFDRYDDVSDDGSSTADGIALAELYSKVFPTSPLIAARLLERSRFSNDGDLRLENAVRSALYSTVSENPTSTMRAIGHLCAATGAARPLDSIITYNYDDLLEKHLADLNVPIKFRSVVSGVGPVGKADLLIYHVHGFLPRAGELTAENKIILSETAYHEQYEGSYSWSNLIQIDKFRSKNCLFLGSSVTDPSVRRLLDVARRLAEDEERATRHWCIRKRPGKDEIRLQIERLAKDRPETPLEDFETAAGDLQSMAIASESADLASFGIQAVWVDEYDEMADFLDTVGE